MATERSRDTLPTRDDDPPTSPFHPDSLPIDRYKHLIALAYRRGPDWTPSDHHARILAAGWTDGYTALQAFADGQPIEQIGPHTLATDIAALLETLEINRADWPHEGEPGPQIAGVRALQRHVARHLPHDPDR